MTEERRAREPAGYTTQPFEARVSEEAVTGKDNRNFSCALCSVWGQLNKNLRGKKLTKEPLQLVSIKPV